MCVLTFGKNSFDSKEIREHVSEEMKRDVHTLVVIEKKRRTEKMNSKYEKWFYFCRNKRENYSVTSFYSFLLRRFSAESSFPRRSFANHLCDCCHRLIRRFVYNFHFNFNCISSCCFVCASKTSFISFHKDGIETEEHLSVDFTMVLQTIVGHGYVSTTLRFSFFLPN